MGIKKFDKSKAIIVMETVNIIGAILVFISGIVIAFQSKETYDSYWDDYNTTHPYVIYGIGVMIFAIISYFYGKFFTNAAYDLQLSRQTNEHILLNIEKFMDLNNSQNKTPIDEKNQNNSERANSINQDKLYLENIYKQIKETNSYESIVQILSNSKLMDYPEIVEKIESFMSTDAFTMTAQKDELLNAIYYLAKKL